MATSNSSAPAASIDLAPLAMDENFRGSFLRDFLNVIFKRKWLVLTFFLSTSLTVAAVTHFYVKPMYKANTQFLITPGRDQISDLTLAPNKSGISSFNPNTEEQVARSIELLAGRSLAEHVVETVGPLVVFPKLKEETTRSLLGIISRPALDDHGLFEIAVERLMTNLTIEPAGKTSLINLSFKHENPEMAEKVANLFATLFVERQLRVLKNPKTDTFFQEQFQNLKEKLSDSENRLEAFKRRYSIVTTVKDAQDIALKQELSLRNILNETRSQQAEIVSRVAQIRQQLANTAENPSTGSILRDKLTTLELQENEMALRFKSENPTLRVLREEIRLVREKVAQQESTKSFGRTATATGSLFAQLQQELLRNEAEQRALRSREEAHAGKLKEFQDRLNILEQVSVEFDHLFQARQTDDQNNRLYQTKFEELRISNAMDAEKIGNVRVIEPARLPTEPVDSKKWLKLLAGVLFGLLGGIALAQASHMMSGKLETVEDIERQLNLPVLASIPSMNSK